MQNLKIYPLENNWGYNNNKYNLFTIYEDDEDNNVLWPDIIIDYFRNLLNNIFCCFFSHKPNHNNRV
jgi:hypothetical protein